MYPIYSSDDKSEWYQRWENNGWRLVSDRVSISSNKPPEGLLFLFLLDRGLVSKNVGEGRGGGLFRKFS